MSRRLHIVGCERSGTTLLLEMVTTGFACDGRCDRELSLFRDPPAGLDLYVSKKPLDILRLDTVFRRDESLYVLYVVRDPRSVITSRHAGKRGRQLSDYASWAACERAAAALEGHPRFLRVRYERLVESPDEVQQEIQARFPFLERTHAFSQFHERANPTEVGRAALGGLRPVETARIAGWENDLARVKAEWLSHPEMARALIDAGYERDESWLRRLDGVDARAAGSSRVRGLLRGVDRRIRYWIKTRQYLARHGLR